MSLFLLIIMVARNLIAKILGTFWILDGLLQFQPKMFGPDFVTNVLEPTLSSQPNILHAISSFGIYLWNTNTILTNTAAALLQVVIGIFLFFPASDNKFKIALYVSVLWGSIVWLFGEGAGGLLTGSATFYTGAPGGALLYVLFAVLLLLHDRISDSWYPKIAGCILVGAAFLQLQPTFWTADGVQGVTELSTMDIFHPLTIFPMWLSNLIGLHPFSANIALTVMPLVLGLLLLYKPNRITAGITLIFLFFVWWISQDFGQLTTLFTGTSTDPNIAPLIALLLVPILVPMLSYKDEKTKISSSPNVHEHELLHA